MRKIKVGMYLADEDDNVVSKRELSGQWSVDLEYELKTHFEVDVKDEIASILMKNFIAHLTPNTIKEMLAEAKEKMSDE
jgi:hypothetical protein